MVKERSQLPIADSHDEILDAIQKNQVVLIRGETGSGKTTQVSTNTMYTAETTQVTTDTMYTGKTTQARSNTMYTAETTEVATDNMYSARPLRLVVTPCTLTRPPMSVPTPCTAVAQYTVMITWLRLFDDWTSWLNCFLVLPPPSSN